MASPEQMVASAQAYAGAIQAQATTAINAVLAKIADGDSGQTSSLQPWPDTTSFDTNVALPAFFQPQPVDLDIPTEPSSYVAYQNISKIETSLVPAFNVTRPTFNEPIRPNQLADFSEQPPDITTSFEFPTAPSELVNPMLTAPTMGYYSAPSRPGYNVPSFDRPPPEFTAADPGDLSLIADRAYHAAAPEFITMINGYVDAQLTKINPQYHAQLARVEAQLTTYLNGGTGLNPAVEDAIYARARSKNDAEARRVRDQALSDAATRGFTMPAGALLSATQQARQAGADNNATAAREIVVMQAEMEQKNLQFAVTTSVAIRQAAVQATLAYMQNLTALNGQALEYAKIILGAVIETYNISIKMFNARLDVFKAAAALYETKLKATMMYIDIYRAEISAMEALVNVDRVKVDIYKAQIDSLMSLASLYKTQVDVVVSKAGLEKLKLDLFQTQVQSYSSQVQAKNSEWEGYVAQISGQKAEVDVYSAQVGSYSAEVQAFKTKIEAQAEVVRAQIATNQAAAEQVKIEADVFKTIVQARSTAAGLKLDIEKLNLAAYSEEVKSTVAQAQINLDYYKTKGSVAVETMSNQIKSDAIIADTATAKMRAYAEAGTAGGQILGHLAGSAMAGMNSLVALTETI